MKWKAARIFAKRDNTRYRHLKNQLAIAEALQKKEKLECRQSFIKVVTNLQLGLGAGRVAAAKARGKFDKAASALTKVEARLEKVCDNETGEVDKSSSSGDDRSSEDVSDNWFSEDELETDEDETCGADARAAVTAAVAAAEVEVAGARKELAEHVETLKVAARKSKKTCRQLEQASDVANSGAAGEEDEEDEGDGLGGNAAFEAAQNGRIEAIRAWKAYKHAQRALIKAYGKSSDMDIEGASDDESDCDT
ncbi:unnamed protein product, partial [Pylaiella littoralis]